MSSKKRQDATAVKKAIRKEIKQQDERILEKMSNPISKELLRKQK